MNISIDVIFIIILATIILCLLCNCNKTEKFDNVANTDIEAIRNLNSIASKLITGQLTTTGNLTVTGSIAVNSNISTSGNMSIPGYGSVKATLDDLSAKINIINQKLTGISNDGATITMNGNIMATNIMAPNIMASNTIGFGNNYYWSKESLGTNKDMDAAVLRRNPQLMNTGTDNRLAFLGLRPATL